MFTVCGEQIDDHPAAFQSPGFKPIIITLVPTNSSLQQLSATTTAVWILVSQKSLI